MRSGARDLAAVLTAHGRSMTEISEFLGVDRHSVARWAGEPSFQAVRDAEAAAIRTALRERVLRRLEGLDADLAGLEDLAAAAGEPEAEDPTA